MASIQRARADLDGGALTRREKKRESKMSIQRKQRVLVVVANLTTYGRDDLKWLYRWLDANAVSVARIALFARYRQILTLTGEEAAAENFVDTLDRLAADPQTQAIDVLINLHGMPSALWFADGEIRTARLADQIVERHLPPKLRLLYSTACYGASHAPDFVRAGFRVASGAIGVNANGAHDYPVELLYWGLGATYRDALKAGNAKWAIEAYDKLAVQAQFEDVCSTKIAVGSGLTRITSSAA
jgi:hypothetical protein